MGCAIEEEVGASCPRDGSRLMIYMLPNRALDRARAIELDFTNGEGEEDTMCPVCHESKSAPQFPLSGSPLNLQCTVYEDNNGRILQCGHEVCAGKDGRAIYVQEFLLFT